MLHHPQKRVLTYYFFYSIFKKYPYVFFSAWGKEDSQMDGRKKALPIGIEFFRDFKRDNYYYVDKTAFIAELLRTKGAVNLFTRPRRFGKSLNINMLKSFF